jgi:alpha-glucosidase
MVNVAAQRRSPGSMLALYRALIELRRQEPALAIGDYAPLAAEGAVLAYRRRHADRELVVALNLGPEPTALDLPRAAGRILLSTHLDRQEPLRTGRLDLRGDEGVILALGGDAG